MKRCVAASFTALLSILSLSSTASTEPSAAKQTLPASQGAQPATPTGSTERQRDEQVLLQIIARWDEGWKTFNAELASRDYSSDADWTNAFGLPKKGKAAIFEFLEGAYKAPSMRSRKSTPSTTTFRFVRPDVVSASSYRETIGQGTPSGGVYPTRKTHDLRVFVREKDKWTIVSHLIMDEKDHLK